MTKVCDKCGKTAKENGTYLNKRKKRGNTFILCNDCLKQFEGTMDGNYEARWFCKHCMSVHEHKNFNVESDDESAVIMSGECQECNKRNNNYFPKQNKNPLFGVGVTDPMS